MTIDRREYLKGLAGTGAGAVGAGAVFADYLPRILASRYPEAIVGFGNALLGVPLKILYPAAWLLNSISLLLLRPFGRRAGAVKQSDDEQPPIQDSEPDHEHPACRPHLLQGIHALDNITVNDILVPRSEVDGINLDDPIEEIIEQLRISKRTRLPVFYSDINQVEAVLNTHPAIQLSAVLGRREADGNEEVLAFVELKPGNGLDRAALRDWLRERLAPYKLPGEVRVLKSMPLLSNGKLAKQVLREQLGPQ